MRILTIVLSLIFAFVCVEFVLRLTDYSRVHLSRWDFDAGVRHLESSSGYYVKESKKKITINDQGIRVANNQKDFKFSENKSKNTYRISVFGDSYTEGLQVEFEERFSFIMERELNLCKYKPKENIEIINFGISGSGQSRQFEMQQGWAKKYESDIILVVTHSNDPRNNYSKLEPGIYYPYWTLENGKMADVVIWDKHPFSVYAKTTHVFIDGLIVFDRTKTPRLSDFETGQSFDIFEEAK